MIEDMVNNRNSDVDGIDSALTYWNMIGQYPGQCLSECALLNSSKMVPKIDKGEPILFCFGDIVFVGVNNKWLTQPKSSKLLISEVKAVHVR